MMALGVRGGIKKGDRRWGWREVPIVLRHVLGDFLDIEKEINRNKL